MSVRWLKKEPPHELEFEGISEDLLKTYTGASSTVGVPKRFHSPKDLVAIGIAGCTGVDVVSILKKMRQPLEDLVIDTEVSQTDEHPRVFHSCILTYRFVGAELEQDRVIRAAALSFGKYCGVSAMIKRSGCSFEPRLLLNGRDLSEELNQALLSLDDASMRAGDSQNLDSVKAAVLITGNELLRGKTTDTNGHFIIKHLTSLGIQVSELRIIGDDRVQLLKEMRALSKENQFIFMTGGLGPTKDDLTSEVVAEAFYLPLEYSEDAWQICLRAFERMGRTEIPESNKKQAFIPKGARVLANTFGTAAGFHLLHESASQNCNVFSLPGVPWECEEMFLSQVAPYLPNERSSFRECGPWHVWGVGESALQTQLSVVEQELLAQKADVHFSYQAHAGYISYAFKFRDTGSIDSEIDSFSHPDLLPQINRIEEVFGKRLLYKGHQSLSERLLESFEQLGATLALAESCTGGRIAGELSSLPGISSIFQGGVVAYSNSSKQQLLKVSESTLVRFGAVSSETAIEMALGVKNVFASSVALSVTGIAGPTGGSLEKPVGTICFSLAISAELIKGPVQIELTDTLALQGWQRVQSVESAIVFAAEKNFGSYLSRTLIQKRGLVFSLCSLVAVAEILRGSD